MDVHPQYTFDKDGNAVGVFISIDEWTELSQNLQLGLPQWQKDALDAELAAIDANPNYLLRWEDVKKQFIA